MTQEQVIAKIKKLLELASSPNEHEANLAMEKAQRLMQEYCIESMQLNPEEQKIEARIYTPKFNFPGLTEFIPLIANAVAPLFGGAVMTNGRKEAIIYAFSTNYQVISHALDCLLNQGREDCVREFAKSRSIAFIPSFWYGFTHALTRKFLALKPEQGLEIWNAAQAEVNRIAKGPGYQFNTYSHSEGLGSGKSSGQAATIRPGVNPQFGGYLK